MQFPSLASAEEYLKNTLQDFYNQRGVLMGRLTKIARLKDIAVKNGDQQSIGQLIVLRSGVMNLLQEQYDLEQRLDPVKNYLGVKQWSLNLFPFVIAGGAAAVAASLYLYYEKLKNQAKALDMVAKGMLPASQAEAILNPGFFSGIGGSFAQVGMFAVGGLVLFVYLNSRRTA